MYRNKQAFQDLNLSMWSLIIIHYFMCNKTWMCHFLRGGRTIYLQNQPKYDHRYPKYHFLHFFHNVVCVRKSELRLNNWPHRMKGFHSQILNMPSCRVTNCRYFPPKCRQVLSSLAFWSTVYTSVFTCLPNHVLFNFTLFECVLLDRVGGICLQSHPKCGQAIYNIPFPSRMNKSNSLATPRLTQEVEKALYSPIHWSQSQRWIVDGMGNGLKA